MIMKHLLSAVLLANGALAVAATPTTPISSSTNQSGFFIGIGGGYNSVKTTSQSSMTLNSLSGIPTNQLLLDTATTFHATQQNFSPEGQLGYFSNFNGTNWLWGAKLSYTYVHSKTMQRGSNRYLQGQNDASINIVAVGPVETNSTHGLSLLAFTGRSIANSFVYLGVGPALFDVSNNISGMSDIDSGYYIGTIGGFSRAHWLWGAAIQAGMTYYLNSTWFLDFNYNYATTTRRTFENTVPFSEQYNGGLNTGIVTYTINQRITPQQIAVSINKKF